MKSLNWVGHPEQKLCSVSTACMANEQKSDDTLNGGKKQTFDCTLHFNGLAQCVSASNQCSHLYKYSSLDNCVEYAGKLTDCLQFKLRLKSRDEVEENLRDAAGRSPTLGVIWNPRNKPDLYAQ